MKKQIHLFKWVAGMAVGCVLITLTASQMHAAGTGQLGILDTSGNNPLDGTPWQVGDQYRLIFISSGNVDPTDASGDDLDQISTWNGFAQSFANNSTTYSNLGDVSWNIVGSTAAVDAKTNTLTDPTVNGTGHGIILIDGSTVIANNFNDLWDGEIQNIIDLTENGTTQGTLWPYTGSTADGSTKGNVGSVGALRDISAGGQVFQGQGNNTVGWIDRSNISGEAIAGSSNPLPIYVMSETLTVVPEASSFLLIGLAGLGLLRRRR